MEPQRRVWWFTDERMQLSHICNHPHKITWCKREHDGRMNCPAFESLVSILTKGRRHTFDVGPSEQRGSHKSSVLELWRVWKTPGWRTPWQVVGVPADSTSSWLHCRGAALMAHTSRDTDLFYIGTWLCITSGSPIIACKHSHVHHTVDTNVANDPTC
jgi:hypothetical protein